MMTPVLIVGCGYVGMRVAAAERQRGRSVCALARSSQAAARLQTAGVMPIPGDLDRPVSLPGIPAAGARVYYFAPPPPAGTDDPRIEAFLQVIRGDPPPQRVVLISTTSVYGDCQGRWIDERCPPNPQTDRARRRLAAENALRAWAQQTGAEAVVLRVAGIYGPGRLPVERLRSQLPVLREQHSPWSNRVHVDDLAAICLAAADRGRPGAIYNVSDGHPSTMTDYFNRAADALALPRPPQVDWREAQASFDVDMLSYLAESRRLDTTRARTELEFRPRYPTLDSGLKACVQGVGERGA